ncbi:MAG: prepilin-type N-terminal cleavage/methylation domain-containing protein [Desulfotignum sp.]|nr:prepilin-type N-terminal cleavage/methylation domain-containing protein [Desulfotignum sp.]MCF8088523.1 prepilin-type N-terminal cleavage/methylation domain-containing protein [Desulfotignum sp.]MCF8136886.1 prepilin-type N-terminal cleavage/methylation domain-containing protein [Desulfotignum sp.]
MPKYRRKNAPSGFTLIEILVALAITSILVTAIYRFFIGQHHAYTVQDQVIEMEQNARAAMDMIRRDLRMAGYHAMGDDLINNLSDFVPSSFIPTYPVTVNLDANPKISEGSGTDPDVITLLSVMPTENNPTTLSTDVTSGSNQITLNLTTTQANNQFNVGDMIHIGTTSEYASVKSISAGSDPSTSILTIDTNPGDTGSNQGVAQNYAANIPIGEIYVISYAVFNDDNDSSFDYHDPGHPVLKRKVNDVGFMTVDTPVIEDIVAENITDMQLIHLGFGEIEVILSSRTDRADHKFQSNSGYRTYTANARIKSRNTANVAVGTTCAVPSAPTNVVLDGLNNTYPCQIHITWDPVTTPSGCEVSGYTVYYGTTSGAYAYSVDAGDVTSHVLDVTAVKACGYYVAVSAVNSAGNSSKSAEQSITDIQAPAIPSGFNAENINGVERKVSLSWDMNTDCDLHGYNAYARHDTAASSTKINSTVVSNALTEYSDSNFTPIDCDTYHYSIEAVDFCPNSSGATTEVSVSPTAPAPPTGAIFSTSGTTDTISWILSEDDFVVDSMNYIVEYQVYDPAGTLLATLDPSTDTWTSTSTHTSYDVRAKDACDNLSAALTISSACTQTPVITFDSDSIHDGDTAVEGTVFIKGVTSSTGRDIDLIELKIDAEDWVGILDSSSFAFEWDTTQVENGAHTITVRATDSEGCYGQESIVVTVSNESSATPQVFCTLFACKVSGNEYMDLLVYVYDQDDEPVSDASVEANILFGSTVASKLILPTDVEGYYGGGDTAVCTLTSNDPDAGIPSAGLAIKSKSKYKDDEIVTIQIDVEKTDHLGSTCTIIPTIN